MKATPDTPKRPSTTGTQRVWALRLMRPGEAVCVLCLRAGMSRVYRSVSGAVDHLTGYHTNPSVVVPDLPAGVTLAHLTHLVSVEVDAAKVANAWATS